MSAGSPPGAPTLALDSGTIETLSESVAARIVDLLRDRAEADGWMTSAEAAEYLAVPISTLRKWTAAGTVPFSQDVEGGRCYFKRDELDRWRWESAQGPCAKPA
jgi:excisionase family DNA binding protein